MADEIKTQITIILDAGLLSELDAEAAADQRSRSQYIVRVLGQRRKPTVLEPSAYGQALAEGVRAPK